jgi:hypothetical protein
MAAVETAFLRRRPVAVRDQPSSMALKWSSRSDLPRHGSAARGPGWAAPAPRAGRGLACGQATRWLLARLVVVAVALVGGSIAAHAASVTVEHDGTLLVDGRRLFVLGLYEYTPDDALLNRIASAGFNLLPADWKAGSLQRLQRHGLYGWLSLYSLPEAMRQPENAGRSASAVVAAYARQPALLLWDQPDEALWRCWWFAVEWRTTTEPTQQREAIAALADRGLAGELNHKRILADDLLARGKWTAAEALADEIWHKLGKPPQRPLSIASAPACAEARAREMEARYDLVKGTDGCHPVWINHAPRNRTVDLERFNRAADIAGCDIYPVPEFTTEHSDLPDRSLACVGAYTDLMRKAAPGKPVFMVLQAFAWADLEDHPTPESYRTRPRPTYDQSRFMAFDAIVHGARGLFYWGTSYLSKGSELWGDVLVLVRELADLQPVLAAPDEPWQPIVEVGPTWTSEGFGPRVVARDVEGHPWLLVVNESPEPLTYTLSGIPVADGERFVEAREGLHASVTGGAFTVSIRGHGVQVLRPSNGPLTPDAGAPDQNTTGPRK